MLGKAPKQNQLDCFKATLKQTINPKYPLVMLALADRLEDKNYWGGLVGISNKFRLNPHFSLHAEVMYKTPGFVEGVVVAGGFILRGGSTVHSLGVN